MPIALRFLIITLLILAGVVASSRPVQAGRGRGHAQAPHTNIDPNGGTHGPPEHQVSARLPT